MSLRLTPEILEAAYEYLRSTRPFNRRKLKLPHADAVEFRIGREPKFFGTCRKKDDTYTISISEVSVAYTFTLMWVMAHEMVHLSQFLRGTATDGEHNEEFRAISAIVCREHGFDPKGFF